MFGSSLRRQLCKCWLLAMVFGLPLREPAVPLNRVNSPANLPPTPQCLICDGGFCELPGGITGSCVIQVGGGCACILEVTPTPTRTSTLVLATGGTTQTPTGTPTPNECGILCDDAPCTVFVAGVGRTGLCGLQQPGRCECVPEGPTFTPTPDGGTQTPTPTPTPNECDVICAPSPCVVLVAGVERTGICGFVQPGRCECVPEGPTLSPTPTPPAQCLVCDGRSCELPGGITGSCVIQVGGGCACVLEITPTPTATHTLAPPPSPTPTVVPTGTSGSASGCNCSVSESPKHIMSGSAILLLPGFLVFAWRRLRRRDAR
jgi:hypothetical protein